MRVRLTRRLPDDVGSLAVPVLRDAPRSTDDALDWDYLARRGFEGEVGQVESLPGELGIQVFAVGLGPVANLSPEVVRRAAGALARAARRERIIATTLLDAVPDELSTVEVARGLAEGLVLASYSFDTHKSQPDPSRLEEVAVVGLGGKRVQRAIDVGVRVGEAVGWARDLVNEPGGSLTPGELAAAAVAMGEASGVEVRVLDRKAIAKRGMGGLLGVNRGSEQSPHFIELAYEPAKRARGTVALVGKGVTFDSGGLSLKTNEGMTTMKDDMAGAAAVLATFSVLADLEAPVRVLGFVPATDNMTGGDATRPGDVLRISDGTTVEVLNTDAEGRLILADALVAACAAGPDAVIDVATLTGSCQVALGNKIAGLMGNDRDWTDQILDAARRSGERAWELPLPVDYRSQLSSEVADLKNVGTRHGGALVAGLFLQSFVDDELPWVHLDIAGTAWSSENDGLTTKGATGYGVRLLLDALTHFRKPR